MMAPLIITLDGPAGSGKSTVARQLAARLGLEFLDTGAMYRGLAAQCLDNRIDPAGEPEKVAQLAEAVWVGFDWSIDPPQLLVGDRPMTDRLREPDVTGAVSEVAAIPAVRRVLVAHQQRIGREHPRLVSEGRDQGSVVFPDAPLKFYLDATVVVRARRRTAQFRAVSQAVDEAQILESITHRDHTDARRADGPLICPADAVRIDTSAMMLDAVVAELESVARGRLGAVLRARSQS